MTVTASAAIFDLDGTLIDSLEDLADAGNRTLSARSMPTHPVEPYKYFVGDGMENLMRRAAPEGTPEDVIADMVAEIKREYGANWAKKTRPYAGVRDMLAGLAADGVPMAVLSNKPHEFTEEVVKHFFPEAPFAVIQGSPLGGKAKPDPTLALSVAATFGLRAGEIAFVGDSRTDMDTACNAGMIPVGVLWGFRPEQELLDHGAKVIIRNPLELRQKISFSSGA